MHRLALRSGLLRCTTAAAWSTTTTTTNVTVTAAGPLILAFRGCSTAASNSPPPASSSTPGKVKVHIESHVEKKKRTVEADVGLTLMEVIRDVARMDMEAACDGTCACSTCHVIFEEGSYKKLSDTPSEDEMDMLDLAPAVTKTSRLSCQVKMSPELDGISVVIPDETENQMR